MEARIDDSTRETNDDDDDDDDDDEDDDDEEEEGEEGEEEGDGGDDVFFVADDAVVVLVVAFAAAIATPAATAAEVLGAEARTAGVAVGETTFPVDNPGKGGDVPYVARARKMKNAAKVRRMNLARAPLAACAARSAISLIMSSGREMP